MGEKPRCLGNVGMRRLFLCLNELSMPKEGIAVNEVQVWREYALAMTRCLLKVASTRPAFSVVVPEGALSVTIAGKPFRVWLSEWMGKKNYTWLQTKIKPGPPSEESLEIEVLFQNTPSQGLTLAHLNQTWAVSLAGEGTAWASHTLDATLQELLADASFQESNCTIKHLGSDDHSDFWAIELGVWGAAAAADYVIGHMGDLDIVMYPNDHAPPHIHLVDAKGKIGPKQATVGKYRIDKFGVLEAHLPSDAKMRSWVEDHNPQLLASWKGCQIGKPPIRISVEVPG